MSWLPAMMFMHVLNDDEPDLLQNPPDPVEQYSTGCNAGNTPVIDNTPASNSTEYTPTVAPRSWHYTAMSAATFALSAFLGYIATETIFKRVRSRN